MCERIHIKDNDCMYVNESKDALIKSNVGS